MRKTFFAVVFFFLSVQYSFYNWGCNSPDSEYFQTKPFIYRTLVPTLAEIMPFDKNTNVSILVLLSCVGLGMLMLATYEKYWMKSLRNDIALMVSFFLTILILEAYKKHYDVPTSFLFLLTFVLWVNKKHTLSMLSFTLLCLNRETAILLVPVLFLVDRKFPNILIFILIYFLSRWMILWVFADAAGSTIYNNLLQNAIFHVLHPVYTMVMITVSFGMYFLSLKNTISNKIFIYILFMFPVLFVLYVFAGWATEVRVFAEVMPIMFMSAFLKNYFT